MCTVIVCVGRVAELSRDVFVIVEVERGRGHWTQLSLCRFAAPLVSQQRQRQELRVRQTVRVLLRSDGKLQPAESATLHTNRNGLGFGMQKGGSVCVCTHRQRQVCAAGRGRDGGVCD